MLDDDFDVESYAQSACDGGMANMFDMCRAMFSTLPDESSVEKAAKMRKMFAMCDSMCGGMNQQEMMKMCVAMFAGASAVNSEKKSAVSNCGCKDGCC